MLEALRDARTVGARAGWAVMALAVLLVLGASTAEASCDTDLDGDGRTDVADFEILRGALGAAEGEPRYVARADLDGDGRISTSDYAVMLACN